MDKLQYNCRYSNRELSLDLIGQIVSGLVRVMYDRIKLCVQVNYPILVGSLRFFVWRTWFEIKSGWGQVWLVLGVESLKRAILEGSKKATVSLLKIYFFKSLRIHNILTRPNSLTYKVQCNFIHREVPL